MKVNIDNFSGLNLLTIPIAGIKTISVLVLVGAGGRYEEEKTNGLAHFYEHLLFQGTNKYPSKKDLGISVDTIGAEYNGWTDKELTGFYIKAEERHLAKAIEVLADLICHPLLKNEEIELERNVILQEIAMREDNPQILAADSLWEEVFAGNPLGFTGAGEKETVKVLTRSQFLDFKSTYYNADNITVVVAGKFEQKQVILNISKYFNFSNQDVKSKKAFIPFSNKQTQKRSRFIEKKLEQSHLFIGFPGFSRNDKRKYSQSLLEVVLGGGFSSRLFQKIREEMRLAYYVGCESEVYFDTGIFACFAGLDKTKTEIGYRALLNELEIMTKELISDQELRKAKDYLRGHLVLKLEEPLDIASFYGIRKALLGKIEEPEEILAEIEKVTPMEIRKTAGEIFKMEKASVVLVGGKNINLKTL